MYFNLVWHYLGTYFTRGVPWKPVKKVVRKMFFFTKMLKFEKIFFFNFSKKSFPKKHFSLIFFCVVNENHFTNALHTKRLLF